jgi:hypothetical protein
VSAWRPVAGPTGELASLTRFRPLIDPGDTEGKYSLSSQLFEPVLAPAAGCSDAVPLADHPDQDVEAAEGFHAMSHQFGAEGKPGHTGT